MPETPIWIWVGGSWPNRAPFRRAAWFDGMVPMVDGPLTPASVQPAVELVAAQCTA